MAGPDGRRGPSGPGGAGGRRRFVTRHDVEDAASAGTDLRLGARDVLTHEAAQRSRELGVAVVRVDEGRQPAAGPPGDGRRRASGPVDEDRLRAAVRNAVVAELGSQPPDLDAVIDRVLAERRRSG